MRKCKHCNVLVEQGQTFCPLCGARVGWGQLTDEAYPDYSGTYRVLKAFSVRRLLFFLSVVAAAICFIINLFTYSLAENFWSLIVISSVLVVWGMYRNLRSKRLIPGGKILLGYVLVAAYLFILDFSSGFHKWATSYVIPFITVAVVLAMTIYAVRKKSGYKDYLGYLLAALFISAVPLILFLFSLSTVMWTSVVALAYALLTVLGFYIFSPQSFKAEMKKKFHY